MKAFSTAAIILIAASASADAPRASRNQLRGDISAQESRLAGVVDAVLPDVNLMANGEDELVDIEKKGDDDGSGKKEKKAKEDKPPKEDKKKKETEDKKKENEDKKKKEKEDKKDKEAKTPKPTPAKTPKPSAAKTPKPTSAKTPKPSPQKTPKPTKDRSVKTPKPTPSPSVSSKSNKPTYKPTRKPTRKPTGHSCDRVDDKKPRVKRSGLRYSFKLEKSGAECVDEDDHTYSYGLFKKVKKFSDCADACVKDVRSELLDNFRGYDWDCKKEECRCLYDAGTLNSRNGDRFDRTNRNEDGEGPVQGSKKRKDFFCSKLDEVKFIGNADEFDEGDEYTSE